MFNRNPKAKDFYQLKQDYPCRFQLIQVYLLSFNIRIKGTKFTHASFGVTPYLAQIQIKVTRDLKS